MSGLMSPVAAGVSPVFMSIAQAGILGGVSRAIYTRGANPEFAQVQGQLEAIARGEGTSDVNAVLQQLAQSSLNFQRGITTGTPNLPIRENLESEVRSLVPRDTPLRNRIARRPGAGLASQWRLILSYGGGYGAATVTTGSAAAGTSSLPVASVAGMRVGDTLAIGTAGTLETRQILSIAGLTITLATNLANAQSAGAAVVKVATQPGGGGAIRTFFSETGAPADMSTIYGNRVAAYRLMGSMGSITGLAMAAGANFQTQMAVEKANAITNAMLNEENALLNADNSVVIAPWGDGTVSLAFDGLIKQVSTANGVPPDQIQVGVGALTTAHIDAQLTRLWYAGAQDMYILMAGQEIMSLNRIAQLPAGPNKIQLSQPTAALGLTVTGYVHPITGQIVPILTSRFMSPGTIIFGADKLPDGSNALEVEVLPQVDLPQLAPNENIQGYVAQEIAPSVNSPQVYPFMVSVFEVLKMLGATVFAKSTGVLPAA